MFGPDAEFLPRAPDPEEIVIGGGPESEPATNEDDTGLATNLFFSVSFL